MEFGRVDAAVLRKTDFRLPAEPAGNARILSGRPEKLVTWLGNAKWGRKEWVGKLYPPKTPQRRYLDEYVRFYNSIELNATHYKIYGPAGLAAWAATAGEKPFLFCPKMYQGVTHRGKLTGKTFITAEFLRGVAALGAHLGPVFIQFPENFGPGRSAELFDWLKQLPGHFRYFVEVRHPAWFSDPSAMSSLLETLTGLKMGIVITDTAGRRDCCHMHLTIPAVFIRFVGNSLDPTDYKRCDAWAKRIGEWQKQGLQELFFFMHMHDETFSPELSAYLATKLNRVLTVPVQVPEVKPELAKSIKPRGINEKFSAGLEAAIAKRQKAAASSQPPAASKGMKKPTADGRRQTADSRRQAADGRRQTADSRRQTAKTKNPKTTKAKTKDAKKKPKKK